MTAINQNGLFIRTPHTVGPGEQLELHFDLPPLEGALCVAAEVVSTNGPVGYDARLPMGLGVRFVRMDPATRVRIDGFLERSSAV